MVCQRWCVKDSVSISTCWCFLKQGGPKDAKARQRAANLKKKNFWCGQVCSARNRRKIFAETSCALIVSRAIIHQTMLCQLRLHSSSRCFCSHAINCISSFWSLFIPGFSFAKRKLEMRSLLLNRRAL